MDILAIELLGTIPEDESIVVTSNRGELASLHAGSMAGQEYKNIARRLLGEEVPMLPMEEDRGLLKWLARLFKGQ
jgi:septum site-determining protein MinD